MGKRYAKERHREALKLAEEIGAAATAQNHCRHGSAGKRSGLRR